MKKKKGPRILINLDCLICYNNFNKIGISRYLTTKNKKNTIIKLELKKYCKFCKKHTIHKEIK